MPARAKPAKATQAAQPTPPARSGQAGSAEHPPVVADVRRDQMLAAAAELIVERGFSETRIADVAARVGASPALVNYYFKTKDLLLTEALRWSERSFYAGVEEMLRSTPSLVERVETLVAWTCLPDEQDEVPGSWGLWFDLWVQAFRHPEVKKDRVELDQRWRDVIARVVRDGIEAGEIEDVDVESFAVMWAALLDGLVVQVALDDPLVSGERAQQVALDVARKELGLPTT
jgi:AcrR family transcriptional regulator